MLRVCEQCCEARDGVGYHADNTSYLRRGSRRVNSSLPYGLNITLGYFEGIQQSMWHCNYCEFLSPVGKMLVSLSKIIQCTHGLPLARIAHGSADAAEDGLRLQEITAEVMERELQVNGERYKFSQAVQVLLCTPWHRLPELDLMEDQLFRLDSSADAAGDPDSSADAAPEVTS